MKKLGSMLAVSALIMGVTLPAQAGNMAKPMEAKSLTIKAMQQVDSQGADAAYKAFAVSGGAFQPKDLYMFCLDMNGVMTFHAKKPQLAGKNLLAFNKYGETFFADMTELAKTKGEGWVNYKWPYPGTEEIREKASYIKASADKSFYCGSGAYK
ncbi:cache domain-containing protein [Magnetococcus sp. PR-3]|uniref:cache domain-containing protein n=1 Tax=Magnetococcus sp. PR-3 TaxID=3120355 RepID=UPI002FCE2D3C